MANTQLNDATLIAYLRGTDTQRNQAFCALFAGYLRPKTIQYVTQDGGNVADGEDIFQETILVFDRHIQLGHFKEASGVRTYFLGIAKGIWRNQQRRHRAHPNVEFDQTIAAEFDAIPSIEVEIIREEEKKLIDEVLTQIKERCKEILTLWGQSYKYDEIAAVFGLSSPDAAKKEKYRCQNRMRDYIKSKPHLLELLKNMI